MPPTYYSIFQLAAATGRSPATVRRHVQRGWLKQASAPGAQGLRFLAGEARRWLRRLFPQIPVLALDAPLPSAPEPPPEPTPPPVWNRSLYHDAQHLVRQDGIALCGAQVPQGCGWFVVPPHESGRHCRRCIGLAGLGVRPTRRRHRLSEQ